MPLPDFHPADSGQKTGTPTTYARNSETITALETAETGGAPGLTEGKRAPPGILGTSFLTTRSSLLFACRRHATPL